MGTKYTQSDLAKALDDLEMLKFFPKESRAAVGALLVRMVPHKEALMWLVRTLVDNIGEWPGPAQVRGLLCTRFKPLDGIEQDCALAGFRPQDYEDRAIYEHEVLKAGGWTAESERLIASAKPKMISGPTSPDHGQPATYPLPDRFRTRHGLLMRSNGQFLTGSQPEVSHPAKCLKQNS